MSSIIHEKEGTKVVTIMEVQNTMASLPQVDTKVEHFFSEGVYTRVTELKAGTLAMGKRHRHSTVNILLKGVISIYVGENEPPHTVEAPFIFISEPNVKKLAYAHTDVLITNIHPTEETDLDVIEELFTIPDEEYRGKLENFEIFTKQLEGVS